MKKNLKKRRDFIKKIIGFAASTTGIASANTLQSFGETNSSKSNKIKPNILLIYTDQQALWTISAYAGKTAIANEIHTPNIDRIAKEGILLENYFTNSAVCTPSRGCFVSGLYPHQHGAYANNIPLKNNALGDGTWGSVLQKEGYKTSWIGKWHLDGKGKPKLFANALGFEGGKWRWNRGHWKGVISEGKGLATRIKKLTKKILSNEHYTTNWLTDRAIDFIKYHVNHKKNTPFALTISFPDPHGPHEIYAKYAKMYRGKVSLPKSMDENYDNNRPNWANSHKKRNILKSKTRYLGMVKCIDDNVGRLLDVLDEHKITDNTIVIFTTDHGEFMGEHGMTGKNKMYEPAFHIPFLIKWPKHIPQNVQIDNFITTVDVKNTLLSLLGIDKGVNYTEGKNASSILFGGNTSKDWENIAYLHHASFNATGIVTPDWFMAHVKGRDSVLFNRKNDLEQIHNLAYDSDYADIMEILTEKLYRHHLAVETPRVIQWLEKKLNP